MGFFKRMHELDMADLKQAPMAAKLLIHGTALAGILVAQQTILGKTLTIASPALRTGARMFTIGAASTAAGVLGFKTQKWLQSDNIKKVEAFKKKKLDEINKELEQIDK